MHRRRPYGTVRLRPTFHFTDSRALSLASPYDVMHTLPMTTHIVKWVAPYEDQQQLTSSTDNKIDKTQNRTINARHNKGGKTKNTSKRVGPVSIPRNC